MILPPFPPFSPFKTPPPRGCPQPEPGLSVLLPPETSKTGANTKGADGLRMWWVLRLGQRYAKRLEKAAQHACR